jgi:hypothetical protein
VESDAWEWVELLHSGPVLTSPEQGCGGRKLHAFRGLASTCQEHVTATHPRDPPGTVPSFSTPVLAHGNGVWAGVLGLVRNGAVLMLYL